MSKSRILVIDDDLLITKLLEEHLSNEGFDVTAVHMAEEGFKLASESPPDLIFLDVMLPDATGFQTLGRLRKNLSTSEVPIIMMSGSAVNANQRDIGKGMGASEYILKPFDVIQVGERVRQLMKDMPVKTETPAPIIPADPIPISNKNPIELIPMSDLPVQEPPEPVEAETPALSPIYFMNETLPSVETPIEIPSPSFTLPSSETYRAPSPKRTFGWTWVVTPILLAAHITMTIVGSDTDGIRAATFTAGGWALLLGWLVAICAALRIPLDARKALQLEGWAAIPIVLRAVGAFEGATFHSPTLPAAALWMRPLDIFEIAAILILGIAIGRLPKSSLLKSILAAGLIALGWSLTAHGYFRPF